MVMIYETVLVFGRFTENQDQESNLPLPLETIQTIV